MIRMSSKWMGVALFATLTAPASMAGLFEDEDARKAILELRSRQETARTAQEETRNEVEQMRRSLLQLNEQIDQLRRSLAEQRGLNEQLSREVADLQRRQKDTIQNLDERLRQFEPGKVTVDGAEFIAEPAERRDYEAAMQSFRKGDYIVAELGFVELIKRYPKTGYMPSAMFWLSNAQFAIKRYKDALTNFQTMVRTYPDHPKTPEAMLSIANCRTELKDAKGARKALEELVQKYPKSEAAAAAAERLRK